MYYHLPPTGFSTKEDSKGVVNRYIFPSNAKISLIEYNKSSTYRN